MGGTFDGQVHAIPRIETSTTDQDLPFKLIRHQIPVRLSLTMTINKSQGQTLGTVGVDLRNPVFAHGQLNVALTRVTDVKNLIVLLPKGQSSKPANHVYHDVFLRPDS